MTPDFETFSKNLRGALKHLYDPDYLRRSSLAGWFGVADRYDTPSLLQSILIKGIESLRPAKNTPTLQSDQQNYDILLYRFIQQSSQEEVSHQLGISPRQLRRIQAIALEALAAALWKTFPASPPNEPQYLSQNAGQVASAVPALPVPAGAEHAGSDDFAWLKKAPVTNPANAEEITQKSLLLLQPLADRRSVHLSYQAINLLPALAVHPIALRQILLSLLGEVIRASNGAEVDVLIEHIGSEVCFSINRNLPAPGFPIHLESQGVADAQEIISLSNGRLETIHPEGEKLVRLFLPAIDQIKVVAIDDNSDIIELMQRYLSGSRYVLVGISRAIEAFKFVLSEKPRIIILDVMIPELDGWEILGQFRLHPQTSNIPVVICSILAQEELALTLGAAGFIQKPIRREVLLQVLERAAGKPAQESL